MPGKAVAQERRRAERGCAVCRSCSELGCAADWLCGASLQKARCAWKQGLWDQPGFQSSHANLGLDDLSYKLGITGRLTGWDCRG